MKSVAIFSVITSICLLFCSDVMSAPTAVSPIGGSIAPLVFTTTVYLVRHAEKDENWSGDDVLRPLTTPGEQRAKHLAQVLSNKNPSPTVVYSTTSPPVFYKRTYETVNNYAALKGIKIIPYVKDDVTVIVNIIKKSYKGKSVLVAGHSDTIPAIINALGVNKIVNANTYGQIFIITIKQGLTVPFYSASLKVGSF